MKASITSLMSKRTVGPVDPRVFGGFVEHLGRAIYGGLYDPDSSTANQEGWRTDVLAALGDLQFTALRYPGGNFASGYHWRDGIGPRDQRPAVLDRAWNSHEPNLVGTDEFLSLCQVMDWTPVLTANLGSGTPEEAAEWVEYCSRRQPAIHTWCLGNEMDGDWQIGHAPVDEYVRRARNTARSMREVDPSIEFVACGSSSTEMSTWLDWDRTVLEGLASEADYISLHRYARKDADTASFLAFGLEVDRQIEAIDKICREVARETGGQRAYLCFDEWNVWYRTQFKRFSDGKGAFARP